MRARPPSNPPGRSGLECEPPRLGAEGDNPWEVHRLRRVSNCAAGEERSIEATPPSSRAEDLARGRLTKMLDRAGVGRLVRGHRDVLGRYRVHRSSGCAEHAPSRAWREREKLSRARVHPDCNDRVKSGKVENQNSSVLDQDKRACTSQQRARRLRRATLVRFRSSVGRPTIACGRDQGRTGRAGLNPPIHEPRSRANE